MPLLSEVQALMGQHRWREAILLAAKFPRIPMGARDRILSAREAINRPAFQVAIGKDIEGLIEAGKQALIEEFGDKEAQSHE